jgi:starvation-inducible DNA-binding protein
MASPATSSHLPALAEPHAREAIAHELQSTMQELVDLSLIGKQLHWAVVGHAFGPVHEQLDELVASWRDLADVVAERDAVSQDVLIDVVRTLEHQQWMLRAQISDRA